MAAVIFVVPTPECCDFKRQANNANTCKYMQIQLVWLGCSQPLQRQCPANHGKKCKKINNTKLWLKTDRPVPNACWFAVGTLSDQTCSHKLWQKKKQQPIQMSFVCMRWTSSSRVAWLSACSTSTAVTSKPFFFKHLPVSNQDHPSMKTTFPMCSRGTCMKRNHEANV